MTLNNIPVLVDLPCPVDMITAEYLPQQIRIISSSEIKFLIIIILNEKILREGKRGEIIEQNIQLWFSRM